jgi:hypothetical protein
MNSKSFKPLFERVSREAYNEKPDEVNGLNKTCRNVKNALKDNKKPLPVVELNEQNYKNYLGNGVTTGHDSTQVAMANGSNGANLIYTKNCHQRKASED